MPDFLTCTTGRKIAYEQIDGHGPGVVFLGGFKSDMEGTKAIFLRDWAVANGRAFLRFDYSGHGQSSGEFIEGCIGDWAADASETIQTLTSGPQVLVGSSMGGWISLILSQRGEIDIAGLVGIAAAPDFTEDSMWAGFDDAQRKLLASEGQIALPSDYGEPYIITKRLIDEGRNNLVLRKPLKLPYTCRFLQGTDDADVDQSVPLRILEQAQGDDIQLTLIKGADHRFSSPECLKLVERSLSEILGPDMATS